MVSAAAMISAEVFFFVVVIYLSTRNLERWMQRNAQSRHAIARRARHPRR